MDSFPRITSDPTVLGGRASIRGLRISVSLVLNLVANGMRPDEIASEYPELDEADVVEAIRYAAWLADERSDVLDIAA